MEYDSCTMDKLVNGPSGHRYHRDAFEWCDSSHFEISFHGRHELYYHYSRNSTVSMNPEWACGRKGFSYPYLYIKVDFTVGALMKYTECQCGCKVYVDPFKLGGVSARQAYIICMLCEVRTAVDDQMFHWNANIGMTIGTSTVACADRPIMV